MEPFDLRTLFLRQRQWFYARCRIGAILLQFQKHDPLHAEQDHFERSLRFARHLFDDRSRANGIEIGQSRGFFRSVALGDHDEIFSFAC
jgi:hypothetical protein